MSNSEKIAQRIAFMMKGNGVSSLDVSYHAKFGINYPVELSVGMENHNGEWKNIEVFALHIDMTADTNLGKLNLLEITRNAEDWFLLEIAVKRVLGYL